VRATTDASLTNAVRLAEGVRVSERVVNSLRTPVHPAVPPP
jgi:hypothetical protein